MGRAVDLAATVPMPKQNIFNLGDGVVTPFDEVLASVKALFPSLRYEIEPGEPPKSKTDPLDISAARQHLGWEPQFSVRSAFADYLAELKAARD
jgi:nucleoside-diphosphate-sugar epimerase